MSRTILITGASSGIGYNALLSLLSGGNLIIAPCRDSVRADYVLKKVLGEPNIKVSNINNLFLPVLDLSDLSQIESFISLLKTKVNHIDVLILNAGLQYTGSKTPRWSKQGIELTFAVNHLSHFCLFHKLIPFLDKSNFSRIIVTSSEVHNPKTSGGKIGMPAGLGNLDGLRRGKGFSMLDGISSFSADKSYKDSKLCNILFSKEIFKRWKKINSSFSIIAWAPGLVIPNDKLGFFRYSRQYNILGQLLFSFLARDLFKISETPQKAGHLLALLTTEDEYNNSNFYYRSNVLTGFSKHEFRSCDTSIESNDQQLSKELWELSYELAKDHVDFKSL